MNPKIQSGLIETASPAAQNDAPRAGIVWVVGPAGKGPATPIEFDNAADAYATYGSSDQLARDIELALLGADYGARASGSGLYGRVVGLRTQTGSSAAVDLKDADGNVVLKIETAESSERANSWKFEKRSSGYRVYDPAADQYSDFQVDFTGVGSATLAGSVSELANAMRTAYADQLFITVETGAAHFELSLDDTTLIGANTIVESTTTTETVVDFSAATDAQMATNKSGTTTWIDSVAAYFEDDDALADAHQRVISADNDEARIYAITAGKATSLPAATTTVQIPRLADAKQVGPGTVNSFLNLRTTGATASKTIVNAAQRSAAKKSEAYWRIRNFQIGRFDPAVTATAAVTHPHQSARVVATANQSIVTAASFTIDGVDLAVGDAVLLTAQTTPAEDGFYTLTASGDDIAWTAVQNQATTDPTFISEGSAGKGKLFVWNGTDTIVEASTTTAYEMTFAAAHGIADTDNAGTAAGPLAAAYAVDFGSTAAEASFDRLGTHFAAGFTLKMKGVTSTSNPVEIPLDLGGGTGIPTRISWASDTATIHIDKAAFDAEYGSIYDDAFVYASFDSCIFDLVEKNNTTLLSSSSSTWEYAVAGDVVTFNRPLAHELVVRPLRVTQYRMGSDVIVTRSTTGNKFAFVGLGNQPGEAGGVVNGMEVIFGFDYKFESNFPEIASGGVKPVGGTSGVNADPATRVAALDEALKMYKDQNYAILVPSGIHIDDVKTTADPVTGAQLKTAVPLLSTLKDHQSRVNAIGASGIVYASVKPMKAATNSGRYTDAVKRTRFTELVQANPLLPTRAATAILSASWVDFFLFDAPFALSLNGTTTTTTGTAFFAGMRSAMPNNKALYQLQLPQSIIPLYRFDVSDTDMPGLLVDARINTWSARRNEVRLADERTAAGLVPDARGRLVASSFQSGMALLSAKDYIQSAVNELNGLLGPLPTSGIDTLKATVETILRGVAGRTVGVERLDIDPQRDISVYAKGGSAMGMDISIFLQVSGELRQISLSVGAITAVDTGTSTQAVIPVIGG